MKNSKKMIAAGAAFGVAATLIAIAPAANAEPVAEGYVIVGSDTLQDVTKGLANGSSLTGANVRVQGGGVPLASFDAIGSAEIQAKPYGAPFHRPNGSGDGQTALSRSIDGNPYRAEMYTITGQVDIARSSSSRTPDANGVLLQIPFGRDAIAYAHNGTDPLFDSINAETLTGIFQGSITELAPGVPVVGVIPQAGSGTRESFLALIGVNETQVAQAITDGKVVVGQEHDTRQLFNGDPMPANAVAPQSVAQWVAAHNKAGSDRRGEAFKIASPTADAPVVVNGGKMTPNASFVASSWGRDVYIMVENARVVPGSGKYDAKLASLVGSSQLANRSSLPSSPGALKAIYGFGVAAATSPERVLGR